MNQTINRNSRLVRATGAAWATGLVVLSACQSSQAEVEIRSAVRVQKEKAAVASALAGPTCQAMKQGVSEVYKGATMGAALIKPLAVPASEADAFKAFAGTLRNARALAHLAGSLCECVDSGLGEGECTSAGLFKDGLCAAMYAYGINPANPMFILVLTNPTIGAPAQALYQLLFDPVNPFCTDDELTYNLGSLKCCKYEPRQWGCHTAFNTPAPINCEGNPLYLDTAESFGDCMVPSTGLGCMCRHIAECTTDGANDQNQWQSNTRKSMWFEELAEAYLSRLQHAGADPDEACGLEMAEYAGCRGFFDVLAQGSVVLAAKSWSEDQSNQTLLDAAHAELGSAAATRVLLALPNGHERYNYVASQVWTDAHKSAYLAGVSDPEAELRNYLGACGLGLLQDTMPNTWELMAAPYPSEGITDRDPSQAWQDGCVAGEAPTLLPLGAE